MNLAFSKPHQACKLELLLELRPISS